MALRESNHLSINTAHANSSPGGLPSPSFSEQSSLASTPLLIHEEGMVSTTTVPRPDSLDIPSVTFPTGQRTHIPTLLRQRSFPGIGDDDAITMNANMNRRPSLPVNNPHYHPMERQPSYDPRRQPGYPGGFHFHRQQPQDQHQRIGRPLTPQTPTSASPIMIDSSIAPVVRHPLWKLECRQCSTLLCEQAMQGHLVGDPSQRLFSTNLAIG
ncbi:hypothetical protein BGZ76_004196, partial [Entomortierella beljakovae]